MIVFVFIIIVTGIYLNLYVFYNLILLAAFFFIKEKKFPAIEPKTKFGIIIPAHNEEIFLGRLLNSITGQQYPLELFQTIVVADNCTDNTSKIGAETGAVVLKRKDSQHIGKGYAIKFALESISLNQYDAVFIIDADSFLLVDVLKELNKILGQGKDVIQCYNGVANPDKSWFTRLLNVSRTIGNEIYHPAKQKLGLSSYLMGNGMCFSTKLLLKYGWKAFSIGEDWEYYAKLIQEGETVAFACNARVYHQESSSLKQATSQRIRWSGGRFAIARKYGLSLLYKGLVERNFKKVDASFPLMFPNPSLGMNITAIGFVSSLLCAKAFNSSILVLWFCSLLLIQLGIFLIGIGYTKDKLKNFAALFFAPLFLAWKMGIDIFSMLGMGRKKWVRTKRKF